MYSIAGNIDRDETPSLFPAPPLLSYPYQSHVGHWESGVVMHRRSRRWEIPNLMVLQPKAIAGLRELGKPCRVGGMEECSRKQCFLTPGEFPQVGMN